MKVKLFIMALLMVLAVPASAQNKTTAKKATTTKKATTSKKATTTKKAAATTSTARKATASKKSAKKVVDGWNTVYLQWNPSTMSFKGGSTSFTSFSAGYNRAISLTSKAPVYLGVGAKLRYSFRSDGEGAHESKWWALSAEIPVNVMYRFAIPESSVAILPYAGPYFRINAVGKTKVNGTTTDMFGSGDGKAKRFQAGIQFGCGVQVSQKFLFGLSYGLDFLDFYKDVTINTFSITAGYCF